MSERLADLVAGLSRLADLGFGLQAGESLRSSALAAALGRSLDLPEGDVRAALYTGLLLHVGCAGYAHETARIFGDEFVVNVAAEQSNLADPRDVAFYRGVVEYLADRLADCRVREIPGAGHLGPETEPEPVAAELVRLLEVTTTPQRG